MLTKVWKRFVRMVGMTPAARARRRLARVHPAVMHGFQLRPNTIDRKVYRQVVLEDEYRLPSFSADDVVLDVGSHIGSFLAAAYMKGARRLIGFEPEPNNFAWLKRNLQLLGGCAQAQNIAVWRSDRRGDTLSFAPRDSSYNTGVHSLIFAHPGEKVATRPLDDVLAEHSDNGRTPIRLLKLDCEGSEYPILMTSRRLDWVREIVGEFHEQTSEDALSPSAAIEGVTEFTMAALAKHLEGRGFEVEFERLQGAPHTGLFFARRSA